MAILESIANAKKRGATPDQIVAEIMRQNPDKAVSFQTAQQRGASTTQILQEIEKQNVSTGAVIPQAPQAREGGLIPQARAAQEPLPERQGFLKRFSRKSGKAGLAVGKGIGKLGGFLFPTLSDLGSAIALPEAGEKQAESTQRYLELGDRVTNSLRTSKAPREEKERIIQLYRSSAPEVLQSNPIFNKSAPEIIGRGMQTGVSAAGFLGGFQALGAKAIAKFGLKTGGKQALARIAAQGTIPGAAFGFAQGVQKINPNNIISKDTGKILTKDAAIGALIGTVIAGAGETFRAVRKGMLATRPSRSVQKAFGVQKKWIRKDILNNRDTIGKRMLDHGYKGTSKQVKTQAERNLVKFGNQIDDVITQNKNKVILKSDIVNQMKDMIDDPFLDDTQRRAAQKIFQTIPNKMTLPEANALKQKFYNNVPQSYWNQADPNVAFKGEFMHGLGGSFRREIEKKAPAIANVNANWQTAYSTRLIAAERLTSAATEPTSGIGFKIWKKLLDATVRAPAVATRTAAFQNTINEMSTLLEGASPFTRIIIINLVDDVLRGK